MSANKAQQKVLELALKVYPTADEARRAVSSESGEQLKALKAELEALLAAEKFCLGLRKKGIRVTFDSLLAPTGISFPESVTAHIEARIEAALQPAPAGGAN